MSDDAEQRRESIPERDAMEANLQAKVITYSDDDGVLKPGGMCACCGSGPNPTPEWRADPWYIYKAGVCDADGVFYSQLCEGCLEEIRAQNERRPQTLRDEQAEVVRELLGDDIDGAQAMMDDFDAPDGGVEEQADPLSESHEREPRFALGEIGMTPGVQVNTTHDDRVTSLKRHVAGDWGDVPEEDAKQNDWALENAARILSSYLSSTRVRFWIITEADRSFTTLLLPEEY